MTKSGIIKVLGVGGVIASVSVFTSLSPSSMAQEEQSASEAFMQMDLAGAIAKTPGCLGVDTAQSSSGKNLIFAWFESKDAVKKWYYSETHRGAQQAIFPNRDGRHEPLAGIPDDVGPLMVIASITFSADGTSKFDGTQLPISQIAIEVYKPMPGGLFLGEPFGPESMNVKGLVDYAK